MAYPGLIKKMIEHFDMNIICSAFMCTLIFAILYTFLDDSHFGGLARISRHIKDVHKTIAKQAEITSAVDGVPISDIPIPEVENFTNGASNTVDFDQRSHYSKTSMNNSLMEEESEAEDDDDDDESFNLSDILKRFADRLYYSIVTGSTVGYGDIYPKSWIAKLLASIQITTMFGLLLKS